MGKGDQRTRRGKLYRGTHGKTRPRKRKKASTPPPPEKGKAKKE